MRRTFVARCLGLAAALILSAAHAQGFPVKPVTIVVPFPPGAGPDFAARAIGEKLSPRIGQPVIVENRPGVGGFVGANAVAKAAADGHTLLLTPNTLMIAPHILPKGAGGGLNVLTDLVPVAPVGSTPMLLVANPQLGVKSAQELIALAKKSPGLAYASAGNGSPMHIAGELLKKSAGIDLLHVPYKGVAPAVTDTLGGQVKVLFVALGGVSQHIKSGKLVPLAVVEQKRTPLLPEVPTLAELGYKDVVVDAWYGVLAPKGTPDAVVAKLNDELNAVLAMPDVKERLAGAGIEARGGTAAQLGAQMRDDHARYGRIVTEFGIQAD
jgi:tripartite-type tricarboxylate transporter receptor subunit TctC